MEDLDSKLVDLLSKVNSGIDSSVKLSQEQLHEIIEQTIAWYQLYITLPCS